MDNSHSTFQFSVNSTQDILGNAFYTFEICFECFYFFVVSTFVTIKHDWTQCSNNCIKRLCLYLQFVLERTEFQNVTVNKFAIFPLNFTYIRLLFNYILATATLLSLVSKYFFTNLPIGDFSTAASPTVRLFFCNIHLEGLCWLQWQYLKNMWTWYILYQYPLTLIIYY